MKEQKYPYIRPGKYTTNFEVVFKDGTIVPCYNFATAKTIYTQYVKRGTSYDETDVG
jgi:hypothetical protein